MPFGVKDSIDVEGVPTTLSCPDYAYVAIATAPAVQRLLDAGALYVGKTNLDQFATGLNGTRTPYTVPRSVYGGEMISGGSSSGSALAVALGQVPFAVATDTAGSGRVPAALNGVVGYKPSRGLISTVGLVPACKSLDCLSVMAGSIDDVDRVIDVMIARDDGDPWSRDRGPRYAGGALRVGLPPVGELDFFGDDAMRRRTSASASASPAYVAVTDVSLAPFLAAGALLYQGPWVAERLVEFGDFLAAQPDSIHPVVREILRSGEQLHRRRRLRGAAAAAGAQGRGGPALWRADRRDRRADDRHHVHRRRGARRPIDCNTILGHYTHFGNLLDLLGVAVPLGITTDGRPYSAMLLGPALSDDTVLAAGRQILDEPRARVSDATAPPSPPRPRRRHDHTASKCPPSRPPFRLVAGKTALIVIDMQRDFLLPGGFGESLGNDVDQLLKVVPPLAALIAAAREAGIMVIHTREGHRPDLSDCPPAKLNRGAPSKRIGDPGKYGRILIRGEYGHDIVDELAPIDGELVIDKPGKGAFYATELQDILTEAGITQLLVTGVTTEVCVHTTTREANDRGYECLVVSDCVGSYFPEFQRIGLEMIKAQGGIFGWVADSGAVIPAIARSQHTTAQV